MTTIAIIGFGEAGRIFAQDLARQGQVAAWDVKFLTDQAPALQTLAASMRVHAAASLAEALRDARLIFSLVTASSALDVARQAAPLLTPGQYFLDCNSAAPQTKRRAARAIEARQGRYIDVAVMAPVPPMRLGTPLLLGGAGADEIAARLRALACQARAGSERVGDVSAIKMCRSVLIKGLEALTAECLTAARRYGVEEAVIASLHASHPSLGWDDALPHYLISRIAEHGQRRSEEMREVVTTLRDVGLDGAMSQATAHSQAALVAKMAEKRLSYAELLPFDWRTTVDKLR